MIAFIIGVIFCFISGQLLRGQKIEPNGRIIAGLMFFAVGAISIFLGLSYEIL